MFTGLVLVLRKNKYTQIISLASLLEVLRVAPISRVKVCTKLVCGLHSMLCAIVSHSSLLRIGCLAAAAAAARAEGQ